MSVAVSGDNMFFDTLAYANKLKSVGFTEKQAEMQAELFAEVVRDKLATKVDIFEVKTQLELKIAELKNELIKWVLGVSLAQAAIIISCIKFVH